MLPFNKKIDILLISRFPPPYGGVSTQARLIAEHAYLKTNASLNICTIDLLAFKYHVLDGNGWKSYPIFSAYLLSPKVLISIIASLFRLFRSFASAGLLDADAFIFWRFGLLFISSIINSILPLKHQGLIYSFHVGAPTTVGGFLSFLNHSSHLKATFGEFYTNSKKLYKQKSFINTLAGSTDYFPCSNHCRSHLLQFNPSVESKVLYHGSELQNLARLSARKPKLFSRPEIIVTFLGRHTEEMGVEYFIDFARHLPNRISKSCVFNICGQRSNMTSYLESSFPKFNILSSVSESQKQSLLIDTDILVVPSLNERACFGLAIVEGISAGCFVLARDIGGHREACLGFSDYLFDRNTSADDLAFEFSSNLHIYSSPAHAKARSHLQQSVVNSYDIDKCLKAQIKSMGY